MQIIKQIHPRRLSFFFAIFQPSIFLIIEIIFLPFIDKSSIYISVMLLGIISNLILWTYLRLHPMIGLHHGKKILFLHGISVAASFGCSIIFLPFIPKLALGLLFATVMGLASPHQTSIMILIVPLCLAIILFIFAMTPFIMFFSSCSLYKKTIQIYNSNVAHPNRPYFWYAFSLLTLSIILCFSYSSHHLKKLYLKVPTIKNGVIVQTTPFTQYS